MFSAPDGISHLAHSSQSCKDCFFYDFSRIFCKKQAIYLSRMDVVNTLWTPSVSSGINPTTIWGFKTITGTDNTLPWEAPFILCVCVDIYSTAVVGSNFTYITKGVKIDNILINVGINVSVTYNAPVVNLNKTDSSVPIIYPLQT